MTVLPSRKLIGYIFILIGVLANEVTLALLVKGWYVFYKVDILIRLSIFTFQVFLFFIGWFILKGRSLNWFFGLYSNLSLFLFNTILLLVFLFGWFAYKDRSHKIKSFGPVFSSFQLLQENPEHMETLYPDLSREEIREIQTSPNITSHPTLEYMEKPANSKFYNVGFENMRYSFDVNADNAASLINGSYWVFGGSTTFGYAVSDDNTIPAYLNQLGGKGNIFINFGVEAYFLNLEIEKLLLLLKKGWRPKRVIFIDGLNDIHHLSSARFHPTETPAHNPFGFNYSIENFDRFLDSIKVAVQHRFPVRPELLSPKGIYENIYQMDSSYQKYPVSYFNYYYHQVGNYNHVLSNSEQYVEKLITFYRLNIEFIKHLGRSYGFDFHIFFQPIGLLNLESAFIKDSKTYQNWLYYKMYYALVPAFRKHISQNPIPQFYDISDADKECSKCYVDLTHYSPKLNAIIAQRVLDELN
ncbi:MAG: hypothetical protein HOF21_11875 [Nitrospina sp.]|nr:hypothetical protein [Nitrospina sp.]MBT5631724.1 hypothetical protein [Nitrospina sp.]